MTALGCQSNPRNFQPDAPKRPTGVEGASDALAIKLQNKISTGGIRMIVMGQNHLISLPSDVLFADQSPKLHWNAYAKLNDIVCYLQQYRKISVHVSAFTGRGPSYRRDLALTLARAKAVADYLWSQGIDSRFIFTQGQGSDKPIAALDKPGDGRPNSRIEITFRQAVG